MSERIVFIGGGNMAASLIGGLIAAGVPNEQLAAVELDEQRRATLQERYGVSASADACTLLADAGTLVMAVKPQQMSEALAGLLPAPGTCVLSIAAGLPLAYFETRLPGPVDCVRCMPNTPALLGQGMSGLYASPNVSQNARLRAERVVSAAGRFCWVRQESELDAVTALSGSGPAYFFLMVEAMREAGEQLGLSAEVANQMATQTCVGAASMLANAKIDASQLRQQVTSKGGTTEAAIGALERAGFRSVMQQAMSAAAKRSAELGDELSR